MEEQLPKPSKPKRNLNVYAYFSLGFQLVAATGLMGFLGHYLDNLLKISFPLFLMLGILAGLTASVIKILRELDNNKKN